MKRSHRKLSSVEWEIMNVIWSLDHEVTVRDVLEKAYPSGGKAYTTVQTILNILVRKGHLTCRRDASANLYQAVRPRREVLGSETRSFVDRAFGGSLAAMASFLIDTDELSDEEIRHLRTQLGQRRARRRSRR